MNRFWHEGDLGDIIAAIPVMNAMGGGELIVGPMTGSHHGRESLNGKRFDALAPLIRSQGIGISWQNEKKDFTHDLSDFRHDCKFGESLIDWQARHLGVNASSDPWLTIRRSPNGLGRVVVARSTRYHNFDFPWKRFVAQYRKEILFVGLPEEHRAFQLGNGCIVDYAPTKDLLELAEIIAGATLFAGNQSCPFWIAAGIGVQLLQETYLASPNSTIPRSNARYFTRLPFNL